MADLLSQIRKKLKHTEVVDKPRVWCDTGDTRLNAIFGSANLGYPFGRIFEVAGVESSGKTTLLLYMAGLAQKQNNAYVVFYDAEQTFDYEWAKSLGVDIRNKNFQLVSPYMQAVKGEQQLAFAETLFNECRELIRTVATKTDRPIVFIVDSIPALVPMGGREDLEDLNMKTDLAIPSFLSRLLPRWTGVVSTYNVAMFMVNQLRDAPGVMFGPTERTPGGRAIKFFSSIRVYIKRHGGAKGIVISKGKGEVGIRGILKNIKNKAGSGSQERKQYEYVIYYEGKPPILKDTKD